MVYSYDDQGRLLAITDSGKPDTPVTFRYDERGRKTKVQVSRREDYRPKTAIAGSPFQVADTAPNLLGGGSATTIYDEHDRPTEVQIRDAHGELVSRAVRIYDAQGQVSEEREVLDNPEVIIPAEVRAQILKASGASREKLSEHLTKMMGGQAGPSSIAYTYDAQGRLKQTRRRVLDEEHEIETTYNEHGDKAAEITRSKKKQGELDAGQRLYSEARYSYQYDGYGNWTEEVVSYRSSPSSAFEASRMRRRTLTYY